MTKNAIFSQENLISKGKTLLFEIKTILNRKVEI